MILVVDSGSTKTDWIALNDKGEEIFSYSNFGFKSPNASQMRY